MNITKRNKRRSERLICIACYAVVPIFFFIFYLLMTMSYEDILHRSWHVGDHTGDIIAYIYNYLPRLGEFYQHLTMRFMDIQASFGFGLVLRFIDAAACTALIYLLTFFVLKRRPRLSIQDALIYLGFFVLLMLFETSEIFMYRFSYIHNYILAMLAMVGFLLPYRLSIKTTNPLALIGMVVLGFLFGISTEIAPIAIIIIMVISAVCHKVTKKVAIKNFCSEYRLQIVGFAGIVLGLIFFYAGAGIGGRANGNYGIAYEYVHLTDLLSQPLHTIATLLDHFWYNIRYLAFAFILLLVIIFSEFTRHKEAKSDQMYLYVRILLFCTLFMAAASLIKLHDDIYARFLFPVYLAIFVSILAYIHDRVTNIARAKLAIFSRVGCIVLMSVSVLMTIDMTYGMVRYRHKIAPIIKEGITVQDDNSIIIPKDSPDPYMTSSPIFHFRQLTPVNWDSSNTYMKYDS